MAKKTTAPMQQKRKPRLLWANPFCLLDTSSGASMTVRQMLHQLVVQGYEVQVLGATVFDNPKGMGKLREQNSDIHANLHQLIKAEDGPLTHQLLVTYSTNRNHLTTHESSLWFSQYTYLLDHFKPDIVWFYGGQTLDMLIPDEARDRGIPTAFYLANGSYKATRWCRDIDLVLTDSQATADMYRKAAGFAAKPIGKFIDQATFVAEHHERKRLLYVNPSWAKGASIAVQLALQLELERPDIEIEVVEARADWAEVLHETSQKLGQKRENLSNVIVTPNTSDMREPYSRARVLLAPSLWWESSGRVLAEAMLNGIPALITNRGGMPEMVDDAGIAFDFPKECHKEPYQNLLSDEELQPLLQAVIAFYDDEALYQAYVERAKHVGEQKHHLDKATQRLVDAFAPLVKQRAGNKEFTVSQRKRHRQNLATAAGKPVFKVDASFLKMVQSKSDNAKIPTRQSAIPDFDWQISGKVIVLDSRAKLIKSGAADKLAALGAFGIVSFDPASEVEDPKKYKGSETIQVFQHALLGDGKPSTLYTCLAPEMSSTLAPLPEAKLPEHRRQGAKLLTKLPINTIALDSIEGLGSLDWLILDDLSDAAKILDHGKEALKDTLLIQTRVAFQPTHEKQPSLAELQHWASRNGFRFYRFNNISHYSHIPNTINVTERPATEQESADVLFLPSQERMAALSDEQKLKLAFVLSTVFEAKDMAYGLLNEVDEKKASEYLLAIGIVTPSEGELKVNNNESAGPFNPKDLEGMNLHIMILEKFTAPFIDFMNEYILDSKAHYVITGNKVFAHGLKPQHGVEFISSSNDFFRLEKYMYNAKKIIFHGLWSQNAYEILEKYPALYKKSYWFMWGGDFYYPEIHSSLKHKVIKNIAYLVTPIKGDVEYVRNKYNAKGEVLWALYSNDLVGISNGGVKIRHSKENDPLKVLLGNSAFETNNHFEAIDKISSIKDAGVSYQIICPLSYGPKEYAEKVIVKGREVFGENFKPLKELIPPDEYKVLLESIDVAVFNHERQQAFNTTLILLSMGKMVFMNCRSNVYKQLSYEDFYVGDIDEFHVDKKHEKRLDINAKMAAREYSDFAIAEKIKSWIY